MQRAWDLEDFDFAVDEFTVWASEESELFLAYFQKNWLCDTWSEGWLDMDRPGNRLGLWNTNNSCESFFKTLLRSFLGGVGKRKPSCLMQIVADNVFLYYNNLVKHFYQSQCSNAKLVGIKKNWNICFDGVRHYTLTTKNSLAIVDAEQNTCSCPLYFCKGKCFHQTIVSQQNNQRDSVVRTITSVKPGPRKKKHIPALLLNELFDETLPVAQSKPGPSPKVLSQRTRTRKIRKPARFQN